MHHFKTDFGHERTEEESGGNIFAASNKEQHAEDITAYITWAVCSLLGLEKHWQIAGAVTWMHQS